MSDGNQVAGVTPPTTEQVAEAQAWFGVRDATEPRRLMDLSEVARDHAAVLVRAALAGGPDEPLRALAEWLVSMDDPEDANGREERRIVTLTRIIENARAALAAARPAAEPAGTVSEIRRELVWQRDALPEMSAQRKAMVWALAMVDRVAAARPAGDDTTTLKHTEWLTVGTDEDGDEGAETFETAADAKRAADLWRRRGMTNVYVERHDVTTTRTVSPWAPVDEQDGARA